MTSGAEVELPDEVWEAAAAAAEPVELDAVTDALVARCIRAAVLTDRALREHT